MHWAYRAGNYMGLTYKILMNYLVDQSEASLQKIIELSAPNALKEQAELVLGKIHIENFGSILKRTLPYQPFILQDCLDAAKNTGKPFSFEDFKRLLANIGVFLDASQEMQLSELFIDRGLMKLAVHGNIDSDVNSN